ncbi:hypothetical protein GCM10027517_02610 [Phycicoccus ginsengisoli]
MHGILIMTRLARLAGRPAAGERGAVATIVAILLGGCVLFGMAALAVDVGGLMFERRQLQNGADSATSSMAMACARDAAKCTDTAGSTTAQDVAALNNKNNTRDQVGGVQGACGNSVAVAQAVAKGAALTLCPTTTLGGPDCPPVPPAVTAKGLPYVEVRTVTKEANGSSGITNWFSKANGGQAQSTVSACARAAWGPVNPGTLNVLPVIISYCDWKNQTGYNPLTPGNPLLYPPGPDNTTTYGYGSATNPWPAGSWERAVYTKGNDTTCPNWNGHTAPGGFSVIDNASCTVMTSDDSWYHGTPGSSAPCDPAIFHAFLGKVVYVPVFDCMSYQTWPAYTTTDPPGGCNSGNGSNTYYRVMNYAAFYLTGWYFSSDPQSSINPNNPFPGGNPCTGGDRCMSGFFLKDLITKADLQDLLNNPPGPQPPNTGLQAAVNIG